MKKTALIIVLALAFSLMACGKEAVPLEQESPPPVTLDFNGYNFRILQEQPTEDTFGYKQDSLFYDLMLQKLAKLETETNCTITVEQQAEIANLNSYVANNIAANIDFADIIYVVGSNIQMTFAMAGYLYPLTDVKENLDYENSAKFGSANMLECAMVDGIPYGVVPMLWPNKSTQGNVGSFLAYNNGIIKNYSMPNPREIYESKKWTTEYFNENISQFYVKDGEREVFAMIGQPSNFTRAFLGAAGMRLVAEVDGVVVPSYETPAVINMINWANKFSNDNKDYIKFIEPYTAYQDLIDGNCTIAVVETANIDPIAKDVSDFGILPFPCGPDIEYGSQVTYYSTIQTLSIMNTTDEPENTAIIIDKLLEPFEGYETEEKLNSILYKTMFFNEEDVKLFVEMPKNSIYQYYVVNGYDFMEKIAGQFRKKTASEILGQLGGKMDSIITKYIEPNYQYMKSHS